MEVFDSGCEKCGGTETAHYEGCSNGDLGASRGIQLIAQERQRQIEVEGWTPEHDDQHRHAEMLLAAICYAETAKGLQYGHRLDGIREFVVDPKWPWKPFWFKPSEDKIRNLVKAGALIAAEIDRLQRKG